MFGPLRTAVLTLVAVMLGAGHAACACFAAASSLGETLNPVAVIADAGDAHAGMHHGAAPISSGEHGSGEAPCDPEDDGACSHCEQAALAKVALIADQTLSGAKSSEHVAVQPQAFAFHPPPAGMILKDWRLRWAAPPDRSLVSLKIRLVV